MRKFLAVMVFLVVSAIAVPSFAHHKDGHDGGAPQASPSATPAPTEDKSGAGNGSPTNGCDQAADNDGGEYDSTCDGRPSENGSEDRTSGGTPCAGCVGAADNKNPGESSGKGQQVDGADANNGYECDGNNGVAKGNPAHTACPEDAPPLPPTPTPTPPTPPTPTPTPCVTPAGDVSCDDDDVKPGPVVCQNLKHCSPPEPPIVCQTNCDFVDPKCIDRVGAVCSDDSSTRGATVLPFTGGAVVPFAVAGSVAILSGLVLLRRTRRRILPEA